MRPGRASRPRAAYPGGRPTQGCTDRSEGALWCQANPDQTPCWPRGCRSSGQPCPDKKKAACAAWFGTVHVRLVTRRNHPRHREREESGRWQQPSTRRCCSWNGSCRRSCHHLKSGCDTGSRMRVARPIRVRTAGVLDSPPPPGLPAYGCEDRPRARKAEIVLSYCDDRK
jgi:hypothetical protein